MPLLYGAPPMVPTIEKQFNDKGFDRGTTTDEDIIAWLQTVDGAEVKKIDLFRCNQVADAGVRALAQGCPGLQSIKLGGCDEVTDAGVSALAQGPYNMGSPGLQEIDLSSCEKVTDAGVIALVQGCPGLQTIGLTGCEKVTDAGLSALAQGCPGLQFRPAQMLDVSASIKFV
jgi:hypothetical protein